MKPLYSPNNDAEFNESLLIQDALFSNANVRKRFMEIRDKLGPEDKTDFCKIMIHCYYTGYDDAKAEEDPGSEGEEK